MPPILLLVFNRPEATRQVVEAVRRARPRRLYLAADGPRHGRESDRRLCEEARQVVTAVEWPCEVRTLFRESNLGCRRAVSEAIDWFFEQEEEGIILEDDCVPDPSFFPFASELLERFRHDSRVMVLAAQHFPGEAHTPPHSYFFSRYNHCWGWASWRRAWRLYDRDMVLWPSLRSTPWLFGVGDGSWLFRRYWTRIFDAAYVGEIDSWAYRWTFSCWAQSGLTVLPARNLVTNIGFAPEATHTRRSTDAAAGLPLESLAFPLRHPAATARDVAADRWTTRYHFRITWFHAVKRFVASVPGVRWAVSRARISR